MFFAFLANYALPCAFPTAWLILVARQKYRNFTPLSWRAAIPLVLTIEAAVIVTGMLAVRIAGRILPAAAPQLLLTTIIWLTLLVSTFYVLRLLTRSLARPLYREYAAYFRQWRYTA